MKQNYRSIEEIQRSRNHMWFRTYQRYLYNLAYQMFEWEGLPETIDPIFLEKQLHQRGFISIYKDDMLGYIAAQGTLSGQLNIYNKPVRYQATAPQYQKNFPLYWYGLPSGNANETHGVVIYNNYEVLPTLNILDLYAYTLSEIKETIRINQNAQKTPVILSGNDKTILSLKQIYNKWEGNIPMILADENFDPESIKAINTGAPYVADKLTTLFNDNWNEAMTMLGQSNANTDKKERLITSEVEANDDQIESSANIYLAPREEACDLLNEYYGLNVSVRLRKKDEVSENGTLHNALTPDDRVGNSVPNRIIKN